MGVLSGADANDSDSDEHEGAINDGIRMIVNSTNGGSGVGGGGVSGGGNGVAAADIGFKSQTLQF